MHRSYPDLDLYLPSSSSSSSEDQASCIAAHAKLMILGTHWGKTPMLDVMGNALPNPPGFGNASDNHSVRVEQISTDHLGEFVGTCSTDGRVIIRGLTNQDNNHNFTMNKPIKALALDPLYATSGYGRRFMTGKIHPQSFGNKYFLEPSSPFSGDSDRVLLHEKTMVIRYRQKVLCEKEGPIGTIKWRGRFAAWSTSRGVRVYDVVAGVMISLVKAEELPREDSPFRYTWDAGRLRREKI